MVVSAVCPPLGHRRLPPGPHRYAGWTLVELLLVAAIISTLTALATPTLHSLIDKANVARAIGDIEAVQIDLATFEAGSDSLPTSLAGVGRAGLLDPWGNPYQYLRFPIKAGGKGKGKGGPPAGARRDRFLVPINSTYHLYSMGKDEATQAPLTARASQDDIVRANDGSFIGLAARF
jgi:general secretion pathway protein G